MAKSALPVDAPGVEIAPGIFAPANRLDEFAPFAQVIEDMHTCTVKVAPGIEVQRKDLATWIHRMETDVVFVAAMDCLMDRMSFDGLSDFTITLNLTPAGRAIVDHDLQRRSIANFALSFGQMH